MVPGIREIIIVLNPGVVYQYIQVRVLLRNMLDKALLVFVVSDIAGNYNNGGILFLYRHQLI